MTDTVEMAVFVEKRLDETEAIARAATPGPWIAIDSGVMAVDDETWPVDATESARDREDRVHIAAHDPARVLREVEAKRRILARHADPGHYCDASSQVEVTSFIAGEQVRHVWPCDTLLDLASPHADHPEYPPEIAP